MPCLNALAMCLTLPKDDEVTLTIPAKTTVSIKDDSPAAAVWALQRLLSSLGDPIPEDGVLGEETLAAVRRYQNTRNLYVDGISGPKTQARMARSVIAKADIDEELPNGLLRSLCEGESGNYIAAVNWNVSGGCDCGYVQRRVYMPPTQTAIKLAFDSLHQFKLLKTRVLSLKAAYRSRPAVHSNERAWRLAVLSHNYPLASDRFSRTEEKDLSSYWTTPQKWVIQIGAHFADGTTVQTPKAWCEFYSLGNAQHGHKGVMVRWVQTWG